MPLRQPNSGRKVSGKQEDACGTGRQAELAGMDRPALRPAQWPFDGPSRQGVADGLLSIAQHAFDVGFRLEPVGHFVAGCETPLFGTKIGGFRNHLFARAFTE